MNEQPYDCMLTLALPARMEEEVFDFLQAHPEWVSGFSAISAEGFGSRVHLDTPLEQVRGRARRRLITLLMAQEHVAQLLDGLRIEFRSAQMAYWLTPVLAFGRFA